MEKKKLPVDLLVASYNAKKMEELKRLLVSMPVCLHSLEEFPDCREVEETGKTFEENALLKAEGYARQTGLLTLAEDSGLCCAALDGAPGVYSSRFAGLEKNDHENNLKLLRLMQTLPDNCREAYFISVVAIAEPEEKIGTVSGTVDGYISREMKGENGFGYDSVFFYPPYGKNLAEVTAEMKYQVSHRAKALKKAKQLLEQYFSGKVLNGEGSDGGR